MIAAILSLLKIGKGTGVADNGRRGNVTVVRAVGLGVGCGIK